jgi:hypothetical protein
MTTCAPPSSERAGGVTVHPVPRRTVAPLTHGPVRVAHLSHADGMAICGAGLAIKPPTGRWIKCAECRRLRLEDDSAW